MFYGMEPIRLDNRRLVMLVLWHFKLSYVAFWRGWLNGQGKCEVNETIYHHQNFFIPVHPSIVTTVQLTRGRSAGRAWLWGKLQRHDTRTETALLAKLGSSPCPHLVIIQISNSNFLLWFKIVVPGKSFYPESFFLRNFHHAVSKSYGFVLLLPYFMPIRHTSRRFWLKLKHFFNFAQNRHWRNSGDWVISSTRRFVDDFDKLKISCLPYLALLISRPPCPNLDPLVYWTYFVPLGKTASWWNGRI